jgi:hypothetical protein
MLPQAQLAEEQRVQAHQRQTRCADLSGLFTLWPGLVALRLANLSAAAVQHTDWQGLSSLSCLTSLALQFLPPTRDSCAATHDNARVKAGLPLLRAELLPPTLVQLQLAHAYVCVPFGGSGVRLR